MSLNLAPLACLMIVAFAGCLDPAAPASVPAPNTDAEAQDSAAEAHAGLVQASQEHDASKRPAGKDYEVHETGSAPTQGIDKTFTWTVANPDYQAFEVLIQIHAEKGVPCQVPPSVQYELKGGTQGSSIRRAGSQGGSNLVGFTLRCSNDDTAVLRYAPASGSAPLGDYALKVKIGTNGAAHWTVLVDLDYA